MALKFLYDSFITIQVYGILYISFRCFCNRLLYLEIFAVCVNWPSGLRLWRIIFDWWSLFELRQRCFGNSINLFDALQWSWVVFFLCWGESNKPHVKKLHCQQKCFLNPCIHAWRSTWLKCRLHLSYVWKLLRNEALICKLFEGELTIKFPTIAFI